MSSKLIENDRLSNGIVINRRVFMATAAAAGLTTVLPRPARAAAGNTRKSLQGANVTTDLDTYAKAVEEMLKLPAHDPRNWYRHALTHMMDCPHGNWWFLVWHRGYLGWLERTCRQLTGVSDFALPFWDWTKETKVPDAFWKGVLNPAASEYEANKASFRSKFRTPAKAQWDAMTTAQKQQQLTRGATVPPVVRYSNFDEFWTAAEFHFYGRSASRNLTAANPDLSSAAEAAVSMSKIQDLLAPSQFVTAAGNSGFESARSLNHHGGAPQSIIESEPHDNVHDSIGGQMARWLSPADPIFFMHHCNIDRLWNVWERKQKANSLPVGPPAALKTDYEGEQFLFFHDHMGAPVTMTSAGDYTEITVFNYDYEPGTGDETGPLVAALGAPVSNAAAPGSADFAIAAPASTSLTLGNELAARINSAKQQRFFATVSIKPPKDVNDLNFLVFVGKEGKTIDTSKGGDHFAGTVTFFGDVAHGHGDDGTADFKIGITDTMRKLRASAELAAGDKLQVAVVPEVQEGVLALSNDADNGKGALVAASIGTL